MISGLYFIEGAIKIPTVSMSPEELNATAMAEFGNYIQKGTKLSLFCNLLLNFVFVNELKAVCMGLEYNEQIYFVFPQERTGRKGTSAAGCSNG